MQEKFSVVLEAVTSGFKSKMNEVKNIGEQTTVKMAELKRTISTLKNEMKYTDPGSRAFKEYALAIDGAEKELKQLTTAQKQVKTNSKSLKGMNVNIDKIGNSFGKAVGKVKKFALALLSIRSIYSLISRASQAYLAFDQDLSDKVQNAWAGLGAQLAPILEFIINLLSKAVAYVNAFVAALTGINLVARANTKALKGQAGAAKSTSKALTEMDEITNIQKDAGGGSGGGGANAITLPDVDTSKLENALNKIKNIASTLFDPIRKAWDKHGASVMKSAKDMGESLWKTFKEVGKSFADVWTNGTGETIVSNILKLWKDVFDTIKNVSDAFRNAWTQDDNGTQIIQNIADIFISIQDLVLSIGDSLKTWTASQSFQDAMSALVKWAKTFYDYLSKVAKFVVDNYDQYVKPAVDELLLMVSDLIDLLGDIWPIVEPIVNAIIDVIKSNIVPVVKTVWTWIKNIISAIRGVIQIVKGALKGDWDMVWRGMKKTAKGVINGIISYFNMMINGINKIATPLRTAITSIAKGLGKDVSISNVRIPNIPTLNVGTNFVPEDQLAYIHKGEAVIPKKFNSAEYFENINNNQETNSLLLEANKTLLEILDKPSTLEVNGKELARTTYNDFKNEGNRLGSSSIVTTR